MKRVLLRILLCMVLLLTVPPNLSIASTEILVWEEFKDSIVLDRYSLQKIFTRKITRWPNGKAITVFVKPLNSIEHKTFITDILQIRPFYYQQMLDQQIYSGKANSVIEVRDDNLMKLKIETTPGSIGYVNYELYVENKKVVVVDIGNHRDDM